MTILYSWTAWKSGEVLEINWLSEDGLRIKPRVIGRLCTETQSCTDVRGDVWKLLPENAHPDQPGYTGDLSKLLSRVKP